MITLELVQDWIGFMRDEMIALGLAYDPTLSAQENTLRYLTAKRRAPRWIPRTVHEARQLRIPASHASYYAVLKKLIEQGADLTAYLSRDIQKGKADRNDKLLNAWGVHHLHFAPRGDVEVLLVKLTDSEAFVLAVLPHGSTYPDTWVETSLLEILHSNWPDCAKGKIAGIAGERLTSDQRVMLRRVNANFATAMPDDVVYLGEGGLTASGHCSFDVSQTDKIFGKLTELEKMVRSNEANIRKAFGVSSEHELSIRLTVIDEQFKLYEPVTRTGLSFVCA